MEPEKDIEAKPKATPDRVSQHRKDEPIGGVEACMTVLIKVFSWVLIFLFFPLAIPMCIRTVQVICI